MEQAVYVDLYFLVNFSMDLLCLTVTATLLHRRAKRWRVILAAFVGGGYAVATLLLGIDGVIGFLLDLLAASAMAAMSFATRRQSPLRIFQCAGVQMLVSMILGGVMTALYSMLNRLHLPFELLEEDGLSVWVFALVSAVAGVATVKGGSFLGLSRKTKSVILEVRLFGKEVKLSAMVDSGNLLCDPVSGKSVIVADVERLAHVLPKELLVACRRECFAEWLSVYENARFSRPIPTQTATGSGLLIAIVPENLTVTVGKESYPADYLVAPAPLGAHARGFDAVIALH